MTGRVLDSKIRGRMDCPGHHDSGGLQVEPGPVSTMTKELFGTDGIRGIPGTYPLDDATLYGVARALGKYLLETDPKPRVLIGMDTRESGPHIAAQLAAGLADDGVAFLSAGVITTPGVACLVRQNKYSAGMVISASHNPFHDNGVKLFAGTGMKFPDDVEEHLETEIHQHKGRETAPHGVPVPADLSLDEEYLAYLRGRAIPGADLKGLKMVLDCANGAASQLGPALFRSLGAEVCAIHNQPNGRNINDSCGSLHPEKLREKVLETRSALGIYTAEPGSASADRLKLLASWSATEHQTVTNHRTQRGSAAGAPRRG